MNDKLNWGILGSGGIARTFADAIDHSPRANLAAIASRTPKRPDIAERFPGVPVFPSYEELLEQDDIDAVYICTNHSSHVELAKLAACAGKHIVCEKPLGVSSESVTSLVEVLREHSVFFMEAFMYRLHPQIAQVCELVRSGAIGDLKFIQAEFGFNLRDPNHRIFNSSDFGGALLDAGGYPLSMARLFAGVANGKSFENPISLQAMLMMHEVGVDKLALATLRFPGDIAAQISTGVTLAHGQVTRLYGTKGHLIIESPWFAGGVRGGTCVVRLNQEGEDAKLIEIEDSTWLYEHEVNALTDTVQAGRTEPKFPALGWEDSLGNMQWLERWYQAGHRSHT